MELVVGKRSRDVGIKGEVIVIDEVIVFGDGEFSGAVGLFKVLERDGDVIKFLKCFS